MRFLLAALLGIGQVAMAICGGDYGSSLQLPLDEVSGGFVGIGLGYMSGTMKVTQPYLKPIAGGGISYAALGGPGNAFFSYPQSMSAYNSLSGFVANFNAGYDQRLGETCWSIGFIGGGSLTVVHGRPAFSEVAVVLNPQDTVYTVSGLLTPTKLVDQGNFDAGFRVGYLFNQRVFCFTHLGWSIHRMVFRTSQSRRWYDVESPLNRWAKWYNCFLVGLGIDVRITQHTVVGIALDTHIGARSQNVFYQNGTGARVSFYMRPLLLQGMTVFKYRLPPAPSMYK